LVQLKGRQFTAASVGLPLRSTDETKLLPPRRFLQSVLERMSSRTPRSTLVSHSSGPASPGWRGG
jgi:hypothetical protein